MGLSRRFLNLIVDSHEPAVRSLRCIDLKRMQLFYPTIPPRTLPSTMEHLGLPSPNPNFQACCTDAGNEQGIACYTLAQQKVLCSDQCGRNFLYDAGMREVAAMPEFYRPRLDSLSLFIPSGEGNKDETHKEEADEGEDNDREDGREDEDRCGGEGSLFLMEKILQLVTKGDIGHPTDDLEVLFYANGNGTITSHCKLLPPPPFYWNAPSKIGSYAVVGNGSHICISVNGRGTYFLDTARHTWDKVGDWTLPFLGKVEYVPELKLWFGLSDDGQHLAAADLSTTDSQPQLVDSWEEFQPPEEWFELKYPQIVNLGSGRFCIARFFRYNDFEEDTSQDVAVLTGLDLRPCGDGEVKLEMISHKSMCHMSNLVCRNSIHLVF